MDGCPMYSYVFDLTVQSTITANVVYPTPGVHSRGEGQLVTLIAEDIYPHQFTHWSVTPDHIMIPNSDQPHITFTMPNVSFTVQANYQLVSDFIFSNGFDL